MGFKRSRLHVYYEVLKALSKEPMRITHIMRACNLDTRLCKHVVDLLAERGLIVFRYNNGAKLYYITERGLEFIKLFEHIQALLSSNRNKAT